MKCLKHYVMQFHIYKPTLEFLCLLNNVRFSICVHNGTIISKKIIGFRVYLFIIKYAIVMKSSVCKLYQYDQNNHQRPTRNTYTLIYTDSAFNWMASFHHLHEFIYKETREIIIGLIWFWMGLFYQILGINVVYSIGTRFHGYKEQGSKSIPLSIVRCCNQTLNWRHLMND